MAFTLKNQGKGVRKICSKTAFLITLTAVPGHTVSHRFLRPNEAIPSLLQLVLAKRGTFFHFLVSSLGLFISVFYIVPVCTARWRSMSTPKTFIPLKLLLSTKTGLVLNYNYQNLFIIFSCCICSMIILHNQSQKLIH